MDLILDFLDPRLFTPYVYPESMPADNPIRQFISLWLVSTIGASILYLSCAALSYHFLFDKRLRNHRHFIPNQEWLEIKASLTAMPTMGILTSLCFLAEVRGYSKLYDDGSANGGVAYLGLSTVMFLLFTDMCIYWFHRWLHHPLIYPLHKLHHKWKIATPFASHAFHPLDGFVQSLPYHIYPFLFPLHKVLYLSLFIVVNIWTVSIHDECFSMPDFLKNIVNGAAHHTDHHLKFNYNYGQYFTFWDRLGGSYYHPSIYSENPVNALFQSERPRAVDKKTKQQ
eukprot:m.351750 g.351750  ORF g.351750 m.351750 type:complete len:283 (-) comp16338_c0_seq1:245-1093(-)